MESLGTATTVARAALNFSNGVFGVVTIRNIAGCGKVYNDLLWRSGSKQGFPSVLVKI